MLDLDLNSVDSVLDSMVDLDLNSVDSMVDISGHWIVSNGQAHLVDLVLALPVLIRPHEMRLCRQMQSTYKKTCVKLCVKRKTLCKTL